MTDERKLRFKWTFKAHGRQVVFIKTRQESPEHVLMKAFLWALYLPHFPAITVEVGIGERYKPDLIALDQMGKPLFWGESGQVGLAKLQKLLKRHRDTHFAFAKWDQRLAPFAGLVEAALKGLKRTAPVDLLCFPADSNERLIDEQGVIHLQFADLTWQRWLPDQSPAVPPPL